MSKENISKLRVGISCGDLNGIGLEVVLKTFQDQRMLEMCTPVLYGVSRVMNYYKKSVGVQDLAYHIASDASKLRSRKLNVIEVYDGDFKVNFGNADKVAGEIARRALVNATEDLASNKLDVLITAPINKDTIHSEDFPYNGHTEYLADYANEEHPLMLLVNDNLRVGLVTGHVALKEVSNVLTTELIVAKLDAMNKSLLSDFNIPSPRIAVLGLNPHSGDNGLLGEEEKTIIQPALEIASKQGIMAFGPYPADGFFGSHAYKKFDGVLAMYHDQGLAPFKALSFNAGVNFTAGLPIVRTSPDHGTGFDIAGQGVASEDSFRKAVYTALDIHENRKEYRELTKNPLSTKK